MAAHHRFVWIHPFLDGNSRVGRLLTDAALRAAGLESYGAWCLSRGLAKTAAQYKTFLAGADQPRQGDLDGRGALTEKGLLAFCNYMFDTTIDQVGYVRSLLDLNALRQRIDSYVHARNDRRVPDISEPLKANAALVLYTAFVHGELERAQALELCAMPEHSARRLLSQLRNEGLQLRLHHPRQSQRNERVMNQIANNSPEQALLLGDFGKAVDDAILDSSDAHQNQMMQLLSDPARATKFAKVVFDLLRLTHI
jgi:Fic family protein